ncbi:MFS transporter [Halobacterium sp. KA-6]|uniref:MFS transporter n=1 Tax=Halobacterium sp. KA-6 TaxID=2896368 RepID=UPI001E4B541A|nr:MFS transporter [Halobacterium sp. KA-6]MCD2205046.1 MFS transporter [Halobacterium sp. KA-6]
MRSWRGVGLVTGWQFTASLAFYAIFASTAFVRSDFDISRALTGTVVTAIMLGYTVLLFGTGAAVDGYGERPVMIVGLLGMAVGCIGVAYAPTFPLLLAALVVLGFAYATAMPATNRAIVAVSPKGSRNLAMNVKQVGVTGGSGLGALLVTGIAATRFGWRAGFLVIAGIAVVIAAAFAAGYEGTTGSGTLSMPDVRGLLDDPAYRGLIVAGLFLGATVFTTTGYVVLHMTESIAVAAGFAGAVLAGVQVAGSIGRLVGGALSDRLGGSPARGPALVLTAQGVLAAVCFLGVTIAETPWTSAVAFALLGLFILGFPGVYYATMTTIVDDDEVGAATAGGQTMLNLGGITAPPLFGFVVDGFSYDVAWTLAAAVTAIGAIVVWTQVARQASRT